MPALKRKIGDLVLAAGQPGRIVGFWEEKPDAVTFPYYVDLAGGRTGELYAEYELSDYPNPGSADVWEAMAYAYWKKWSDTEKELDDLRDLIRGLADHAFA